MKDQETPTAMETDASEPAGNTGDATRQVSEDSGESKSEAKPQVPLTVQRLQQRQSSATTTVKVADKPHATLKEEAACVGHACWSLLFGAVTGILGLVAFVIGSGMMFGGIEQIADAAKDLTGQSLETDRKAMVWVVQHFCIVISTWAVIRGYMKEPVVAGLIAKCCPCCFRGKVGCCANVVCTVFADYILWVFVCLPVIFSLIMLLISYSLFLFVESLKPMCKVGENAVLAMINSFPIPRKELTGSRFCNGNDLVDSLRDGVEHYFAGSFLCVFASIIVLVAWTKYSAEARAERRTLEAKYTSATKKNTLDL